MKKEQFPYQMIDDTPLNVTFYAATTPNSIATLLYIHGGGLIFGERDDLPEKYIELLTANGYNLLTIDYPLAPEVKIDTILVMLSHAIDWFLSHFQETLHLNSDAYVLFGRSAGGYLAYLLSKHHHTAKQKGLICFYGYYDVLSCELNQPNQYYNQYPKVAPLMAQNLILKKPVAFAPMNQRFPIYLSGRQFGNWTTYFLRNPQEKQLYSLNEEDLKHLPATFLAHSLHDPDVPNFYSASANEFIPDSYYKAIDCDLHDFDSKIEDATGMSVYSELCQWLNQLFERI